MRTRFSQQREDGMVTSLRMLRLDNLWHIMADMKVHSALFLLQKAELQNKFFNSGGCDDRRSRWANGLSKISNSVQNGGMYFKHKDNS